MAKATGQFVLGPDEKDRLDGVLEQGVDSKDKRRFVVGVLSDLRADESEGDECASRIIDAMAADGLMKALNRHIARDTGVIVETTTGRVVSMPKRANVVVRDDDGSTTGATQSAFWTSLSRASFAEWAAQQIHLAESLRFKALAIRRVLKALDQFPNAQTAGEACRLSGIDPDSLELGWAA